jgi:predicted dehydrogenase/nucleoside-diphosphate-sugar epimerase
VGDGGSGARIGTASPRRVALIGAGHVAATHAAALAGLAGVRVAAIVDPVRERAERLARSCGAPRILASVEELLETGACEAAHLLVPPPLHAPLALPLLEAGLDLLVEKPLAVTGAEARRLEAAAARTGAILGCHQNYLFHPSFRRLQAALASGRLGRLRHVTGSFALPLRQLESGRLDHWMFRSSLNLLLEQAVHPLSLLDALLGPLRLEDARPGRPRRLAPGRTLVTDWRLTLSAPRGTAQLELALGAPTPLWQLLCACSDGLARVDLVDGRLALELPGRSHEAIDRWRRGVGLGLAHIGESSTALFRAVRHQLGLGPRPDAFFATVAGAVAAFHDHLGRREAGPLEAARGRRLVELCEAIAAAAPPEPPRARAEPRPSVRPEILLVGGSGFIGRATVRALLARDRPVAVLARALDDPLPPLDDPRVALRPGDARDPRALAAALEGVRTVVNLAHAGGAEEPEAIERAIVEGAAQLYRAARAAGVGRFVQVSSIAALWLGDPRAVVTGATPVDDHPGRAPYARAKALAERRLAELAAEGSPELVILRPGLVVGAGAGPLHSGLGTFNRPQHCLGWNDGRNPLPFVLVEDVAEAIVRALEVPGIGGRAYNLVGGVRWSAQRYLAELSAATGRPFRFHPQPVWRQQLVELGKWAIKRVGGRRLPLPSLRDLRSRGLLARFDTSDVERDLGWRPVDDPVVFRARAIEVHAADAD